LARRDEKNDPCAQSCMMMKVRMSNPPAGSEQSVSQYEIPIA
jgi:hypothetical protein